jgi:hypothetical protein
MRFLDFVRWPWWQRASLLPVIIVVYIGALFWVALTSWPPRPQLALASPASVGRWNGTAPALLIRDEHILERSQQRAGGGGLSVPRRDDHRHLC